MSTNFVKMGEALRDFLPIQSIVFTMDFNFTHQSLKDLESTIDSLYPLGHNPLDTTVFMLGYYLGETIVKNVDGAKWITPVGSEDENPYLWGISVPVKASDGTKFTAFPMERVANYWGDRSNTLYGFCSMLKDFTSGALDPSTGTDYIGDGFTFKARKASRQEQDALELSKKTDVLKRANGVTE